VITRLVRYAVAATLARLADEMVSITLVLLILNRTGSAALAGLAVAGYTVPAVLTGPLLGAWLGRTQRPKIALIGNELVLGGVAVGLAAGVGRLPDALVVGLTVLSGICLPLISGGFSSLVPRLVPTAAMHRANVVDAVTFNGAAMAGPAVAGTIAGIFGPAVAMDTIATVCLLAALATLLIRIEPETVDERPDPLLALVRAGLRHLARTPPLRAATLTTIVGLSGYGLLTVALPEFMPGIGAARDHAGYVWTAFEVGGTVSALLLSGRLRRFRPERVVFGTIGLFGLALASWPLAGSLLVLIGAAALAGLADGPALPAQFAARQRYSPGPLLAQVSTTAASLKIGGYAVGSALGGWLVPLIGPGQVILLVAELQLVAVGLGWLAGLTSRGDPTRTPSGVPASTGR
jgi:predicted MFS family arabinose efflux permease